VEVRDGFAAPAAILRLEAPPAEPLGGIAFAGDGLSLGAVAGASVWLCSLPAGRGEPSAWRPLALPIERVTALAWADAGDRLVVGAADGTLAVVRATAGSGGWSGGVELVWRDRVGDRAVTFVAFIASDGWVVHGDGHGAVVARDADTGQPVRTWSAASGSLARAGDWLAACSSDGLRVWESDAADGPVDELAFIRQDSSPVAASPEKLAMLVGQGTPLGFVVVDEGAGAFSLADFVSSVIADDDLMVRAAWDADAGIVAMATSDARALVAFAAEEPSDTGEPRVIIDIFDVRPLLGDPAPDPAAGPRVVAEVRGRFLGNPYDGRVAWFAAFDDALLRSKLDVCGALLDDIRGPVWGLSADEQRFVSSREGALLLYEATRLQRAGRLDAAELAYRRSRALQLAAHTDTIAQVDELLRALAAHRRTGRVPGVVFGIAEQLRALRNPDGQPASTASASILSSALEREDTEGRRLILQAAKLRRLPEVALRALGLAADPVSQARAAAVLAEFETLPPAALEPLLQAATGGASGAARWRAIEALGRIELSAAHLAPLAGALDRETDPEARLALVRLAGKVGLRAAAAPLVAVVSDPDADVRIEAAGALATLGDRRALPALRGMAPGRLMLKWDGRRAAGEQAISRSLGLGSEGGGGAVGGGTSWTGDVAFQPMRAHAPISQPTLEQ